jgi:hypothetical protein
VVSENAGVIHCGKYIYLIFKVAAAIVVAERRFEIGFDCYFLSFFGFGDSDD